MSNYEYESRNEAEQFLEEKIKIMFPESETKLITDFLTKEIDIIGERKPPIGLAPPVLRKRFVIKDDDLQFFDSIFTGILSSASAGFFLSGNGVTSTAISSSILGVAIAIFKLGRNAYNKRIQIEERCFKVLKTIHNDEISIDELFCDLERQDSSWTREELELTLEFLGKIPSYDGSSKQLVIQTKDKKWRTSGI